MNDDDTYFCPCCGTPWPTYTEMEACNQRCLKKRQAEAHAVEIKPTRSRGRSLR